LVNIQVLDAAALVQLELCESVVELHADLNMTEFNMSKVTVIDINRVDFNKTEIKKGKERYKMVKRKGALRVM
jgi:hypothetical protein